MLKEKFEQAKKFVKEHKKEVAICVGTIVGGVIVWKITKHNPSKAIQADEIDIPDLDIGVIDKLWIGSHGTGIILNDFTVTDMGAIGEELFKLENITDKTKVSAMITLYNE